MRSSRPITLASVAVVFLVVAVATYLLVVQRKTHHVAMPPDDASPEQVVRAYVAAMDGHDCDTARALSEGSGISETRLWCDDVGSLTDLVVHRPVSEQPRWTGNKPPVEIVDVAVEFNLDWRPFHDDGSMDEGRTVWGYQLMRAAPDKPWRIIGQGTG